MKVVISATLRTFFDRKTETEAAGNTVSEILQELTDSFPDAKKGLYDEEGRLRSFIRIFAGSEDVTDASKHDRTLDDVSEILLLPFVAGGAATEKLISDERIKEISLDDKDIDRFSKHLLLREIGVKGQKRIKAAKAAVFGAGALASPVIQYLAAAGVGTIRVVDADTVSVGNLQSQVIHSSRDVKRPKAASARDTIRNIDRNIEAIAENRPVTAENVMSFIEGFDIVIDCSDNYKARYLINDACVFAGIPLVYAAVYQYEGQAAIFGYNGGPCLRCLYPKPPEPGLVPTCAEGGTISPLAGIVGSIQANEALKLIIGIGEHLSGRILTVDTLGLHAKLLTVSKNDNCPLCGKAPSITQIEDIDYEELCGLRQEEEKEAAVEGLTPEELAHRIESGEKLTIIDVREPHERAIIKFPDALVIPIGQLTRRQKELDPQVDTVFICKEGKRSILAINTLRDAGYKGPLYNLKGGMDAMKDIIFSSERGGL